MRVPLKFSIACIISYSNYVFNIRTNKMHIVCMHFVGVPNNVCWVGVWRWSRSTKERLKEWQKLPAPKIGAVDVEIICRDLISHILSRRCWMNWRWPQKASITTAIYKPRFELSTTWLRCKNSNHSTASFGFLLHLPFIIIVMISDRRGLTSALLPRLSP
jgi:hypothetical protein